MVVELYWRLLRKPSTDYWDFVHVLDSACGIAFHAGSRLKEQWRQVRQRLGAGDYVVDSFPASRPPNLPAENIHCELEFTFQLPRIRALSIAIGSSSSRFLGPVISGHRRLFEWEK